MRTMPYAALHGPWCQHLWDSGAAEFQSIAEHSATLTQSNWQADNVVDDARACAPHTDVSGCFVHVGKHPSSTQTTNAANH